LGNKSIAGGGGFTVSIGWKGDHMQTTSNELVHVEYTGNSGNSTIGGGSPLQKINAFKITRLSVSGFKCFSGEQVFDFGDITFITGDNHVGKTSIADAIAFAFCGRLFSGAVAPDRLYSDGQTSLRVSLGLVDETGTAHELNRERKKDKVSIAFDGYNVRQKDLDVIFGEPDVFLSILNPVFFIEYLGNDGQALLQKYLPLVKHEAVLKRLTEHQRILLENESLLSPETYIGNQREALKGFKDGLIALDGQKALLMTQAQDGRKDLAILEQRKNELSGKIGALRQKREEGANLSELKQQYTDILLRIDETSADKPDKPDTAQLDLNIRRATVALEDTLKKQYESKYAAEIENIQAELQLARQEYRKKEVAHHNVRAGVECPVCCRPITEDVLETTRNGIDRSMKALVQQGVEKNTQFAQLRELEQKAKDVFEQWKIEDTEKQQQRIAQLQKRRDELLSGDGAALSELLKQRQVLEEALDLGGLTVEEKMSLDALEAEMQGVSSDYEARKALCERPAPDIDGKAKQLEELIRKKEDLIAAALDYLGARNELTFRGLPLDKVGFSLYDILKTTGEVKNAFRFNYEGRDYRKLSHSERISAGMEVSELMKALTGRNYPVFVDDSESVVTLAKRPSGQVLLSRVVGGVPLTVMAQNQQPARQPEQEMKKAS